MSAITVTSPPAYVLQYMPSPAQGEAARAIRDIERRVYADRHALRPAPPPFDALDPQVAARLSERWKEPCEAAFEHLATHHPIQLLRWIKLGNLEPADLTFAAEIAGRLVDSDAVKGTLVPLLSHAEAVVREGAIYGLNRHIDEAVKQRLSWIAKHDRSAAVRTAAADALDGP